MKEQKTRELLVRSRSNDRIKTTVNSHQNLLGGWTVFNVVECPYTVRNI